MFCGLYLTKPVIVSPVEQGPAASSPEPVLAASPRPADQPVESLLPRSNALPGEAGKPQSADPRRLVAGKPDADSTYEETNLRVQHVLRAQAPDGADLGKIMLEVPVMYRSRSLRWTPEEIAKARALMTRIGNYQEASRMIRDEGQTLLAEWNQLVGDTIPAPVLRADSPSLPAIAKPESNETLDSTQAIEIQNR
ncbi:hypothetical protein [Luteolibacter marinus]|uniref:hypothetical protein n=1 Tax=Luteolibacter marinus TaxID=2776705 RepID=UPI001867379C|nr:hypothetical protein [Luteolibacter marinus]